MKKITAEIKPIPSMSAEDVEKFMSWVWEMRALNMFDKDVIGYPRTVMLRADADGEPVLYAPMQPVLMWDSLAPKPGLSPRQEALALLRLDQLVGKVAQETGHAEVMFFCKDNRVADICARHGYEELTNVRVLRKKVHPPKSDTEQ